MKNGRVILSAAVLIFFVRLEVGGTEETPPRVETRSDEVVVTIVSDAAWRCENAFNPSVTTIKSGMTVVWINQDRETHTLVSSEGKQPCYQKDLQPAARTIDVGPFPPRMSYRKTFTKPGEYPYACHLPFHHMSGKIVVLP